MHTQRHSRLPKPEPVDWHLEILPEDDKSLPPPPQGVKSSVLSPDEYELWRLHETMAFGGLFPITDRDLEVKLELKRIKKCKRTKKNVSTAKSQSYTDSFQPDE
jgi:hypothetical protein